MELAARGGSYKLGFSIRVMFWVGVCVWVSFKQLLYSIHLKYPCVLYSREQLRNFRSSLFDGPAGMSIPPPAFTSTTNGVHSRFSTTERLAEQKDWLKKFSADLSFGATYPKAPGSDPGSVYP